LASEDSSFPETDKCFEGFLVKPDKVYVLGLRLKPEVFEEAQKYPSAIEGATCFWLAKVLDVDYATFSRAVDFDGETVKVYFHKPGSDSLKFIGEMLKEKFSDYIGGFEVFEVEAGTQPSHVEPATLDSSKTLKIVETSSSLQKVEEALKLHEIQLHPIMDFHPSVGLSLGFPIPPSALTPNSEIALFLQKEPILAKNRELQTTLSSAKQPFVKLGIYHAPISGKYCLAGLKVFSEALKGRISPKKALEIVSCKLPEKVLYYFYHDNWNVIVTVSCWILATYMCRMFTHFPILNPQGERESGKSTLANLVERLAYNPSKPAVKRTGSALYRTVESARPTLIIDVTKVSDHPELLDLFEACTEKGRYVDLVEEVGGKKVVKSFDVYAPVFLATREDVPFEPKTIKITTCKPPTNILGEYQERRKQLIHDLDEELNLLRHAMIIVAVYCWDEILNVYDGLKPSGKLVGRIFDYWSPLLAVCKVVFPNEYGNLISYIENEYLLLYSPSDFMVEVENAVKRILAEQFSRNVLPQQGFKIYLKDLTHYVNAELEVKVSHHKVKSALRNLGVVKSYYHSSGGVQIYLKEEKIREFAAAFEGEIEKQFEDDVG